MHDRDLSPAATVTDPALIDQPEPGRLKTALRGHSRNIGLLVALAIALHHQHSSPARYCTWENAKVVGLSSSYTMIAALGTAFLMIGGNIDLSIGSNLALAAVVAALLANHVGSVPAILLAILLAGAVGLANGLLVWRVKLSPLIITLGSLTAIEGVVQVLTGGAQIYQVPSDFSALGLAHLFSLPSALFIAIVLIPIAYFILNHTTFGQYTFAIGANRPASFATGLNVRRLVLVTFALNGFVIGLIGVLEASLPSCRSDVRNRVQLDVITAVILGGVAFTGGEGTIAGVVIAVAFLGGHRQ